MSVEPQNRGHSAKRENAMPGGAWMRSRVRRSRVPAPLRGCRMEFAVALLDPSRADMALHRHADMVRAIVGARQVEFLSGLAGSQSQDALAETRCAEFTSR